MPAEIDLESAMEAALVDVGLPSWAALAKAAGVSLRALGDLRRGKETQKPTTLYRVEKALRWPRGRIAKIRSGDYPPKGEPPMIATSEPTRVVELAMLLSKLTDQDRRDVLDLADTFIALSKRDTPHQTGAPKDH